ncbi:MAG: arylesterase [Butyrivibrio sp.]|nr:arylesterase [Butyrivibrio sp.]
MRNILAFGDSNTWGLIPGTKDRYGWGIRWTSILQEKLQDTRIIEQGLCGRTTVFEDELRPLRRAIDVLPAILESTSPIDAAVIMLGTNDCKRVFHASPHVITKGLEQCLNEIKKFVSPENILIVSPIHLGNDVWREDKDPEFDTISVETSKRLKDYYSELADRNGCGFLAASDFAGASHIDEEHLDEEGHKKLAGAVAEKLSSVKN